jgi:nucleoside 2-deoxyribosyltransferase
MKLFCAYAFTGENLEIVTQRMQIVVDTLNAAGHEAYCNRFDTVVDALQEQGNVKAIFNDAFNHIEASDALVAIVSSPTRSIGQIMEIGTALSHHKPVYLFEHTSAVGSSYLAQLADRHYTWNNLEDLRQMLDNI